MGCTTQRRLDLEARGGDDRHVAAEHPHARRAGPFGLPHGGVREPHQITRRLAAVPARRSDRCREEHLVAATDGEGRTEGLVDPGREIFQRGVARDALAEDQERVPADPGDDVPFPHDPGDPVRDLDE